MKHTVRKIQNKVIADCEPQGHVTRNGLIVERYINNKTGEGYEIVYDSDTTPVSVSNISTGATWKRD